MIEGLYNRYPTESPGSLTVMRHSRHGDQTLAAFCVINGLHDYVTDVTVEQHGLVKRFAKAVEGAKRMADGEKDDQAKLEFWSNVPSVHVSSSFKSYWIPFFASLRGACGRWL